MRLHPKIQKALEAVETARAELVAVLWEFGPPSRTNAVAAKGKRPVTRTVAKAVDKKTA
jgi:hypothetical protein